MKKTNKLLALLLVVVMIASMIPVASANNTKTFTDVNSTDWFYADVMAMAEMGVIDGYNDGTYKPQAPVTFAEFSSLISKAFYGTDLEKEVKGEGFVDVDNHTTIACENTWADEDGTYGCSTSDSGESLKIFWSNTIGGASCITPFWFGI